MANEQGSGPAAPAVAAAPRLARRVGGWQTAAGALGFDTVRMHVVRETGALAQVTPAGDASIERWSERRLQVVASVGNRVATLSTTDVQDDDVIAALSELRTLVEQGVPELFGTTPSAQVGPAPAGPFDALSLADPALMPPRVDQLRELAGAVAGPTGRVVSVTGRSLAEAVARPDGAIVAVQHTLATVQVESDDGVLTYSTRFWDDLPQVTDWTDTVAQQAKLRMAAPVPLSETPVRLITHPAAGVPLVRALVALPLRTRRLSSRLTVWSDPWVARGVGSTPFDERGQALQPVPLIEGGLQRRRWSSGDAVLGNLRVSRGGRGLERLVQECDAAVLVRRWHSVDIDPDSGRMRLVGRGWRLADGKRVQPLPTIVVRGNLPDLFRSLMQVGNDPFTGGIERTPTLVFEPVVVAER